MAVNENCVQGVYELLWTRAIHAHQVQDIYHFTRHSIHFHIPNTIVYQRNIVKAWYFTSKQGAFLKRKPNNCYAKEILKVFLKNHSAQETRCDIVACYYTRDNKGCFVTRNLNVNELKLFLADPGKGNGVLQEFVIPQNDYVRTTRVLWSPFCIQIESRTNIRKLCDNSHTFESRTGTFETNVHNTILHKVNPRSHLAVLLQDICNNMIKRMEDIRKIYNMSKYSKFGKVTEKVRLATFNFRICKQGRVNFLYATELDFIRSTAADVSVPGELGVYIAAAEKTDQISERRLVNMTKLSLAEQEQKEYEKLFGPTVVRVSADQISSLDYTSAANNNQRSRERKRLREAKELYDTYTFSKQEVPGCANVSKENPEKEFGLSTFSEEDLKIDVWSLSNLKNYITLLAMRKGKANESIQQKIASLCSDLGWPIPSFQRQGYQRTPGKLNKMGLLSLQRLKAGLVYIGIILQNTSIINRVLRQFEHTKKGFLDFDKFSQWLITDVRTEGNEAMTRINSILHYYCELHMKRNESGEILRLGEPEESEKETPSYSEVDENQNDIQDVFIPRALRKALELHANVPRFTFTPRLPDASHEIINKLKKRVSIKGGPSTSPRYLKSLRKLKNREHRNKREVQAQDTSLLAEGDTKSFSYSCVSERYYDGAYVETHFSKRKHR